MGHEPEEGKTYHLVHWPEFGLALDHYQNCAYIAQFTSDAQVYIYTHASLPLERGILEDGIPEFAVIDESFFNSCLDFFDVAIADLNAAQGTQTALVWSALHDGLRSERPLLQEVRAKVTGQSLEHALEENKRTLPHFSPYWLDKKQVTALKNLPVRPRIREVLETLQAGLAAGRPGSHAFTLISTENQAAEDLRPTEALPALP